MVSTLILTSLGVLFLSIGTLFFLAVILFAHYYRKDRNFILRELKNSGFKRIDSILEDEYVLVCGKIIASEPLLTAPFSKRKCVGYRASVKENRQGVDEHWHIVNEVRGMDFLVDVGHCTLLIEIGSRNKFKMDVIMDFVDYASVFGAAKPHYEAYLKSKGRTSKNILGISKSMDFEEGVLLQGDMVAVKGIAKWLDTAAHKQKSGTRQKQLMLRGTEESKLLITNNPKAIKAVLKRKA